MSCIKKIFTGTIHLAIFFVGLLVSTGIAQATVSWDYPFYNVDISINEDTTFDVKEHASFDFTGELNGMRRNITLYDSQRSSRCGTSGSESCGGFEFLLFKGLEVDKIKLSEEAYSLSEVENEDTGDRYFRVEKRLYNPAQNVVQENHEWKIEYSIYGGIQWLSNASGKNVPFFYWNILPEDRGGTVENAVFTIQFPSTVQFSEESLHVYGDFDYTTNFSTTDKTLTISIKSLYDFQPVTISYEFKDSELQKPGELQFNILNPTFGVETYINNRKFEANSDNIIKYFPVGSHTLEFRRFGYESMSTTVDVNSDTTQIIDVQLTPTPFMQSLLLLNWGAIIIGVLLTLYMPIKIYRLYKSKGADQNMPSTIIPLFKPPKDVQPYLLGSVKDEVVDFRDITGTIIDLAYRGFIKIKETKPQKEYELTKLPGKEGETLNAIESNIMTYLFNGKEVQNTKDLTYTNFGSKILMLQNTIYSEMVEKGWFTQNPNDVRKRYMGYGAFGLVFGIALTIIVSGFLMVVLGIVTVFTLSVALAVWGILNIFIAKAMPQKTPEGSKVLAEVLGFYMYMHTAERYRVQNLTPEEFEKYLSYAVVFGIEKEWADAFKDIYKVQPEWFEGSTPLTDIYMISSFTRGFVQSTQTSITPVSSSGSSRGSGWSGGSSSFGGFSGGGGGGGSSGGW